MWTFGRGSYLNDLVGNEMVNEVNWWPCVVRKEEEEKKKKKVG